jgi:hypothetical protein
MTRSLPIAKEIRAEDMIAAWSEARVPPRTATIITFFQNPPARPACLPLASSVTYAAVSQPEYRKIASRMPEISALNPPAPPIVNQDEAMCTVCCSPPL